MIYGLTEADLQRLDKEGIKSLIKSNNELLKVCASNSRKKEIEEDIKELEKLLSMCK